MIRLMGARKFIDMPPGTLYVRYWLHSEKECFELIKQFESDPRRLTKDIDRLCIYQDNSASLILDGQEQEEELTLTDINVVGDAGPEETLYAVFDLDDIPNPLIIGGYRWTRRKIRSLINQVIKDRDPYYRLRDWVYTRLDQLAKNGNRIIDLDLAIFL